MSVFAPTRNDPSRALSQYSPNGAILMPTNWDGTPARPDRCLCGFELVDLATPWHGETILNAAGKAYIEIVFVYNDSRYEAQTKLVDFSAAEANLGAVTREQIVTALNGAHFTNMIARLINDPLAPCVAFQCTDPNVTFLFVYGRLAGALGFGGFRPWTGHGVKMFDFVTDDLLIDAPETLIKGDALAATLMGGYENTETSVNNPAQISGSDFTLTMKAEYGELRAAIEGAKIAYGSFEGGKVMEYETLINQRLRKEGGFEMWIPNPRFEGSGAQNLNDSKIATLVHVWSGTPELSDNSGGAISLTTFGFIIHAKQYVDEYGERHLQPERPQYTMPSAYISALLTAARVSPQITELQVIPVKSAVINNNDTANVVVGGSLTWVDVKLNPEDASGFVVSFEEPGVALGCTFTYNSNDNSIKIKSGATTGTEAVIVTFTNSDGTTITSTLSVAVNAT